MKKVTIGGKPTAKPAPSSPDDWVNAKPGVGQPTKRLTIDIPLSLHQRVKSQCALKGLKMADVLRELFQKHFPQEYQVGTKASDFRGTETDSAVPNSDPPTK
jgi:hypothetical protein